MADKYQTLLSGRETMIEATVASLGAANAGEIVALDGTGRLDASVLPVGVGPDVATIVVNESAGLSAGDYVNIFNNGGTPNVRLADASNDRAAHGFVKATYADGANATVYFEGPNDALTGLTPGARQYLGAAGNATATAPVLPGSVIHQFLGIAVSTSAINTDIEDPILL
jgi:hypothetical protein